MITTNLIIAHLLSDFVLQPSKLIKWKMRSGAGMIFHVAVFAFVASVFLFPYLIYWQTWVTIGAISVIHLLTDYAKINIALKKDSYSLPFLTDQAIHFASLIIGGYFLDKQNFKLPSTWFFENIYSNLTVWIVIALLIYVIYIADIVFVQKGYLNSKIYKKNSNKIIITKLVLFTVVFAIYLVAAILLNR